MSGLEWDMIFYRWCVGFGNPAPPFFLAAVTCMHDFGINGREGKIKSRGSRIQGPRCWKRPSSSFSPQKRNQSKKLPCCTVGLLIAGFPCILKKKILNQGFSKDGWRRIKNYFLDKRKDHSSNCYKLRNFQSKHYFVGGGWALHVFVSCNSISFSLITSLSKG